MRTVAIIQARMLSTRLPQKVLADIAGQPLLAQVIARARRTTTLTETVIATTLNPADNELAALCDRLGVPYFRGSEEDVLDRYWRAAERFSADVVVRLTADCPLLDPKVIDRVVRAFHAGEFDYVSNTLECTYPDGLDTEVFSRAALERAWREAEWQSQREHVTSYITDHPELFRLSNVRHTHDRSAWRWTVDEPEDLAFVRAVYEHCGPGSFGLAAVEKLLAAHPELAQINQGFARNEGYAKSLREDRKIERSPTP